MTDNNKSNTGSMAVKVGVGVAVVLIFLAVVVYSRRNTGDTTNQVANTTNQNTQTTNTTTNSNTTPTNSTAQTGAYKAGTYSATGAYMTPGGKEEVSVSLTIDASGKVTTSNVTAEAKAPTSAQFQKEFINNYKQYVTGKSISDLKLSKVSGSSLTGTGFNAAVEKIKQQASAGDAQI